jgi:hypothetical protein
VNYINLLQKVGQTLRDNLTDVTIKLTPWQAYAGQGYDKLTSGIVVLVNLGNIYITHNSMSSETRNASLATVETDVNIELSIGKRNLKDEDDFAVEEIAQKIEEILTNLDFEGCSLFPTTISTGVIDEALNYWRHLTFKLISRKRIGG